MLRRWVAWLRAETPFVLVIVVVLAAAVYLWAAPGHWRRGSAVIALALLLAGVFRLALSAERAGLLCVRGRLRDGFTYLVLGGLVLGIAIHLH